MDRVLTYPGAIPLSADFLTMQRNNMVAIGAALQAVFGTASAASGFACSQLPVPGLGVQVSAGALTQYTSVDSTAFGELAADTTESVVKQGVNLDPTTINLTAPATSGQSINYLIEAAFSETDTNALVLPYVNASDPSQPYSGPENSGTAQYTDRIQRVTLQAKAGAAAATGSQTTPAADSGFVPLFVVTVAYGASAITNAMIATHPAAPLYETLPQLQSAIAGLVTTTAMNAAVAAAVSGLIDVTHMNISASQTVTLTAMRTIITCANVNPITLTIAGGTKTGQELVICGSSLGTVTIVTPTGNPSTPPVFYMQDGSTVETILFPALYGVSAYFTWDGLNYRVQTQGNVTSSLQSKFSTVTSGAAGAAGSYTITKWPDPTTSSGYRVRITGQTANFTTEGSQTVTFPIALNGICPGSWQAGVNFPSADTGATNDQIAQIIGTPTTTQMIINMDETGGGAFYWPVSATYQIEGW